MYRKTFAITKTGICVFLFAVSMFVVFWGSLGVQFLGPSAKSVVGEFVWVAIYFVLPVLLLVMPTLVCLLCKLNLKKTVAIFSASVLLYAVVAFGTIWISRSYLCDFTSTKWEKYEGERYLMLKDLAKEVDFKGMTGEEVVAILGRPQTPYADTDGADVIEYNVGSFSVDPAMLSFVLEDGKVTEVYVYTEFREAGKSLYEQ